MEKFEMKYTSIIVAIFLSACSVPMDSDLVAHLEAERDFHDHLVWKEDVFEKHDPEYISDCFYYEDLICEFEGE